MDILFLILIVIVSAGVLVYKNKKYKETAYYQITKNPYRRIDKGMRGEYLIYERLRHLEKSGGKFLFNVYLPKTNNETTEIDVLIVSPKGLFVFESKNYGGWIFGNEAHKNWTQVFPAGKGRSHKEQFYNPVRQNASHINHLRRFIGENIPVWSIIVFSDQCTLKDITIRSRNVHVVNRNHVAAVVAQIYGRIGADILSAAEITDLYDRLYPHTQVSPETREQHAMTVRNYFRPH